MLINDLLVIKNPYTNLPQSAFWKTGVAQENPNAIEGIYKKKFDIPPKAKIATAGSCFAQHISRHLKKNGYNVLDVEPPPPSLPKDLRQKFGYSMYSARYGNIYTVRQLMQLAKEAAGEWSPQNYVWEKDGRFFDALRPAVEPQGFSSLNDVQYHRRFHISRVKELFLKLDVLIFTLGLTEMWVDKKDGTVYPTAPGVIAGQFDEDSFEFQNPNFRSINRDMREFVKVMRRIRKNKDFKMILTVSPVPLTATASGNHVLSSTVYSKSVLRAIAGYWAEKDFVDYFPSYEIVTNPRNHSTGFSDNLRSVRNETVEVVMKHFFASHSIIKSTKESFFGTINYDKAESDGVECEEELLEVFGR